MKGIKVLVSRLLFLEESQVKAVALCAGSGSSVLRGTEADLYLTGKPALASFTPFDPFLCILSQPWFIFYKLKDTSF